jgi:hypothetical protein
MQPLNGTRELPPLKQASHRILLREEAAGGENSSLTCERWGHSCRAKEVMGKIKSPKKRKALMAPVN